MSKIKDTSYPCFCEDCGGTQARRTGNCYEVCAHYALKHGANLVHGHVTAPKDIGEVGHPELDHAWCEVQDGPADYGVPTIWEPFHSRLLPKVYWDHRYKARYDAVYSPEEARRLMLKFRHYGPWPKDTNGHEDTRC